MTDSYSAAPAIDLRQVVEAILFAAPKPLTARQIVNLLNKSNETHGADFHLFREVPESRIEEIVAQLQAEYQHAPRGVVVQQVAGGFRFGTRPETATWVRQLFEETRPARLSQPALETLAIVAYRQPISRADIEGVRGVAVDGVVTTLLERRLIKMAGRSEAPGRPLLYETTPEFLECFGLKGLDELPNADELRHIRLERRAPAAETPAPAPGETPADTAQPYLPSQEEGAGKEDPSAPESPLDHAAEEIVAEETEPSTPPAEASAAEPAADADPAEKDGA